MEIIGAHDKIGLSSYLQSSHNIVYCFRHRPKTNLWCSSYLECSQRLHKKTTKSKQTNNNKTKRKIRKYLNDHINNDHLRVHNEI